MKFKVLATFVTALSALLMFCHESQAFVPPNTWKISVTKVNNQWTYIVDPEGITKFQGEFYFDGSRLNPLSDQPVGLQGINIRQSDLGNGVYRALLGETHDPSLPSTAVSGDIFQITFDALDDRIEPPQVRWTGTAASGFNASDQPVVFPSWDVTFPVPEPGSLLLILCGTTGFLVTIRPRQKQQTCHYPA